MYLLLREENRAVDLGEDMLGLPTGEWDTLAVVHTDSANA